MDLSRGGVVGDESGAAIRVRNRVQGRGFEDLEEILEALVLACQQGQSGGLWIRSSRKPTCLDAAARKFLILDDVGLIYLLVCASGP